MNTEPVVTKDELIGMLTHENVELHKKIQQLEAQLETQKPWGRSPAATWSRYDGDSD